MSAVVRPCRDALAAKSLRRELWSMVKRRVPSSDVDDIVQAVLCDALAAVNHPDDPADIPRWVMAIARHKVADFHRRARREEPMPVVEATPLADPIEERDLLRAVLDATKAEPAAAETIRWVVREHGGERLRDIAVEVALPAEVVRQRVSRLRKHLRARWLLAAAALGVLAVLARQHPDPLAPTPVHEFAPTPVDAPARAAAIEAPAYRIVELALPATLDPAVARWVQIEAEQATVQWEGDRVVITTPARTIVGRLSLAKPLRGADAGRASGTFLLEDGRSYPLDVQWGDSGRSTIFLKGPYVGTELVLER